MRPDAVDELADRFGRSRDEDDFRRLHRAIERRLWLFALRLTRWSEVEAEELIQETWLRAVRGWARREGRSRFVTWLMGIAVRADHERRRGAADAPQSDVPEIGVDVALPDNAIDLECALATLPAGARRVLLLHDLEGFTHAEVGALLGVSAGTSKSQLHEARKRTPDELDDLGKACRRRAAAGAYVMLATSPSRDKMKDLIPTWEAECAAAGMVAGAAAQDPPPEGFEHFAAIDIDALAEVPFEDDPSKPNGSSIALLAQYNGKSALLSGDAHADLLEASIGRLRDAGAPLEIELFKLPHHGSRKNLSKTLLQALSCNNYLVSTSGSYFDHPDPVAMSRLIKYGGPNKHIWFNYSSDETKTWNVPSWKQDWDYALHYPGEHSNGYQVIDLE